MSLDHLYNWFQKILQIGRASVFAAAIVGVHRRSTSLSSVTSSWMASPTTGRNKVCAWSW